MPPVLNFYFNSVFIYDFAVIKFVRLRFSAVNESAVHIKAVITLNTIFKSV